MLLWLSELLTRYASVFNAFTYITLRTILAAALGFVEFVLSVGLTLTMTAAIVALVRSEMRMEPAAPRPDA